MPYGRELSEAVAGRRGVRRLVGRVGCAEIGGKFVHHDTMGFDRETHRLAVGNVSRAYSIYDPCHASAFRLRGAAVVP